MKKSYGSNEEDWFETLFGFPETNYDETKSKLLVKYRKDPSTGQSVGILSSSAKPETQWSIGRFDYPSLRELRRKTRAILEDTSGDKKMTFRTVAGDVQHLHGSRDNMYATIQVASQFNCLEFVEPGVKPESGVTKYCYDKTQGPACCLCTGPAIVYRNYLHHYEDGVVCKTHAIDKDHSSRADTTLYKTTRVAARKCERSSSNTSYQTRQSARAKADIRNYLHHYEDEVVRKTHATDKDHSSNANTTPYKTTQTAAQKRKESSSDTSHQTGQSAHRQADMLSGFSRAIGNITSEGSEGSTIFWDMKGGYMMSSSERLGKIPWSTFHNSDNESTENRYDELMQTIRIGVHEDIQVTHCGGFGSKAIQHTDMRVTHCLSSAVPVTYNAGSTRMRDWEPLARIILKASYECVFHTAILNMMRHNGEGGSHKIFLTLVGGGVFGNRGSWIKDAIMHCCTRFKNFGLEVFLVYYGKVNVGGKKIEKEVNDILARNKE